MSLLYASPCLWNQLPLSLRQPHSGNSYSISVSPIPSPITSSSSDSPLCTSITPSLFHSRFKTHFSQIKTYLSQILPPVVSLLPPGLAASTDYCFTISSKLLGLCFIFPLFFRFCAVRKIKLAISSAFERTLIYRIVSYCILLGSKGHKSRSRRTKTVPELVSAGFV